MQPAQTGAASGLLTTAQQFASALGIAIIGGLFSHLTDSSRQAHAHALVYAATTDTALMVGTVALAAILTRLRGTQDEVKR